MTIKAVVWGENVHEQTNKIVAGLYPDGMHGAIAAALNAAGGIEATTATLQEPEHGLSEARLAKADVLLWWGHAAHGDVDDKIVERVADHVNAVMGLILLHSAHFAPVFQGCRKFDFLRREPF
jgi:trehalose utilization protein